MLAVRTIVGEITYPNSELATTTKHFCYADGGGIQPQGESTRNPRRRTHQHARPSTDGGGGGGGGTENPSSST